MKFYRRLSEDICKFNNSTFAVCTPASVTVVIDDSNDAVQYPYNSTKDLRTTHEILALMLAFAVEEMARFAAKKTFVAKEGYSKMCNAKREIEKFLEEKYGLRK